MERIKVDYAQLSGLQQNIRTLDQQTLDILNSLSYTCSHIDMEVASSENIASRLRSLESRVRSQQSRLQQYNSLLNNVHTEAQKMEQDLGGEIEQVNCSLGTIGRPPWATAAVSAPEQPDNTSNSFVDTLFDVGKNFGIVGEISDAAYDLYKDPSAEGLGKYAITGIGIVAGFVKDGEVSLGSLLGLGKTVDAIGFRENLAIQLEKYVFDSSANIKNMSSAAKSARNIGVAVQWAGVALDLLDSISDNAEEFNYDFSNPRMYAEILGEVLVGEGLKIAVGAGVSALLGATAPAWAPVLITTIGLAAVNGVVSHLSNGEYNLNELISDGVINLAEKTVEGTKAVVNTVAEGVGSAVETAANFISSGWNKLFG